MEMWFNQQTKTSGQTEKTNVLMLSMCTLWNSELARARRMAQRLVGRIDQGQKEQAYKKARKNRKLASQRSKRERLKELCSGANINPWESTYAILMGRFRGLSSPQFICPILLLKIIHALFSQQERETVTLFRDF